MLRRWNSQRLIDDLVDNTVSLKRPVWSFHLSNPGKCSFIPRIVFLPRSNRCYIYMRGFLNTSINVPIGLYDRPPPPSSLSLSLSHLSLCHPSHSLGHYLQPSPLSHYSWILPGKVFIRRFVRLGPSRRSQRLCNYGFVLVAEVNLCSFAFW